MDTHSRPNSEKGSTAMGEASEEGKPGPLMEEGVVILSEEEKERRRQEMMSNASWRDREREKNVKKLNEKDRRESQKTKDEEYDSSFLQ